MCPNCVTPWKCNGPHLTAESMSKWQGLDQEQKAGIAVELIKELLEEVAEYKSFWGELPEFWCNKDLKAMKRTQDNLVAFFTFPSLD